MDEGESIAYVTDIPPVRRPQVRAYRVQVCRCRSCGKAVRGQHPDIGSDQHGASAHRLGDRVKAAAHVLHYGVGVPVRRIPAVLRVLTGVEVSRGRSARTRCAVVPMRWVRPTARCEHRCERVRLSTPTTRAGELEASRRF